jgi:hypothetical protein
MKRVAVSLYAGGVALGLALGFAVIKDRTAPMAAPDPHGQVALMLCESLLHVLVEEAILTREKALEAIGGVAELMQDTAGDQPSNWEPSSPAQLIERIAATFAAKD